MNKKFSTLMMMGMLVAIPSFAGAQTEFKLNDKVLKAVDFETAADKSNTFSNVLVIRDVDDDGKISASDLIFTAVANQEGEITYKAVPFKNGVLKLDDEAQALWSFSEQNIKLPGTTIDAWFYSLKNNNTGVFLTGNFTNTNPPSIVNDVDGSLTSAKVDLTGKLSSFFTTKWNDNSTRISASSSNLILYKDGTNISLVDNALCLKMDGSVVFSTNSGLKLDIILATAEPRTVDVVDELNDVKGGQGFQFSFPGKSEGSVLNNIFEDQNLRAFRVDINSLPMKAKDSIGWKTNGNYYRIPAGIYLASDWSELTKTEDGKKVLTSNTITKKEDFQKLTFVAIASQDFTTITNTDRSKGHGFKLTTVKGSDMNFYDAEVAKKYNVYDASLDSKDGEVFVGNACFRINVPNPLTSNDQYQLYVDNARLDVADNGKHANKKVAIGLMKNTNNVDDDTDDFVYLISYKEATTVKAVPSSNIADVTELLNEDATPAIYAVKFLSGDDVEEGETSEYGQYMTFASVNNNFALAAMPNVNDGANENDPLYQFVVSGVADNDGDPDKEYETIELTNRLTGNSVSFVLYNEEELGENVYTIYPAKGVNRDAKLQIATTDNSNEEFAFETKAYRGMIVELIKKENVDKFATFETAQSEQGLYTFEFARTAESGDRLYAAAKRNAKTGEIAYPNSSSPKDFVTSKVGDQFELVRVQQSNKKDKVTDILNDFVYLSNDRVLTSSIEKDTVAFYSYHVKFFAPDEKEDYYLCDGKMSQTEKEYAIKYNVDGSVSLFAVPTVSGIRAKNETYLTVHCGLQDDEVLEVNNINIVAWETNGKYYDFEEAYNDKPVKTFMVPEAVYGTLNAVPQTTAFENEFGYVNMNADKGGILKPVESMTFRLDTVDTDKNIPSFYISKEIDGLDYFMYYATDSAQSYRLTDWKKYEFENGNKKSTRLIFKAGELVSSDTLKTAINNKPALVAEKANVVKDVKGGLNYFKFQVLESGDGDGTYVIRNKETKSYVININGNLTLGSNLDGATRFTVDPEEIATANEKVAVSTVKVIAGEGQLTIAGAAGKKVVVSNILGQVVANTVISSDNAVIAAPAGVAVVAVEGEAAVKAIVR